MNDKHKRIGREKSSMEELREMFAAAEPMSEVRMLSIHPQTGIRMICGSDPEAGAIIGDDDEIIFELDSRDVFLSCKASDLIRIARRKYLMGSGIVYKLDRDDDYADMSTDEMAEACLELFGRMQHVRLGQFCFPVIDLNDEEDEDDEEE